MQRGQCCSEKNFRHCGECGDLPCPTLQEAFNHPEHGDKGERLANLRTWARGKEAFIKIGTFQEKG